VEHVFGHSEYETKEEWVRYWKSIDPSTVEYIKKHEVPQVWKEMRGVVCKECKETSIWYLEFFRGKPPTPAYLERVQSLRQEMAGMK
jgi:hypothetical protein